MVKHTQTIHRRLSTNYFSVSDHFCGVGAERFSYKCANLTKFNTLMHIFPKCSGTPLKSWEMPKDFWIFDCRIFKVCLGIFGRYALHD